MERLKRATPEAEAAIIEKTYKRAILSSRARCKASQLDWLTLEEMTTGEAANWVEDNLEHEKRSKDQLMFRAQNAVEREQKILRSYTCDWEPRGMATSLRRKILLTVGSEFLTQHVMIPGVKWPVMTDAERLDEYGNTQILALKMNKAGTFALLENGVAGSWQKRELEKLNKLKPKGAHFFTRFFLFSETIYKIEDQSLSSTHSNKQFPSKQPGALHRPTGWPSPPAMICWLDDEDNHLVRITRHGHLQEEKVPVSGSIKDYSDGGSLGLPRARQGE